MTHAKRSSRVWLTGVVAAVAALAQLGLTSTAPANAQEPEADSCAGAGLDPAQVGIQLYTARRDVSADGLDAVVGHFADVGMTTYERFAGLYGLTLEDYQQVLADNAIGVSGSHGSLNPTGFDAVIDEALALGQEYVGSGGWAPPGIGSLENTLQTAANMNAIGEMAAAEGLKVYGHNHDAEFTTMYDYDLDGDGTTEPARAIEILMAETNPDFVTFEIDVHWARVGLAGGRQNNPDLATNINDPSNQEQLREWMGAHADRIELLHVKDTNEQGIYTDVPDGTTDWPALFEVVPNVQYYYIENDGSTNSYTTASKGFQYLTCGMYAAGDQDITVTVPESTATGEFLWSVQGDGSVDLGEMADQGTYLRATGPLDPIWVTDTRTDGPRWSISGQVSDFAPGNLAGNHLGWNPRILERGAGAEAGDRVASGINGGPGLSVPQTMAHATDGHDRGSALVGANLDLRFPAATDPGEYTATLTITALS